MSSMEDDAAEFLRKIVKTLSAALVWLLFVMIMGIYNGWFFFHRSPTLGNYIFYSIAVLSLVALLWYFYRVWRQRMN